MIDWLSSHLQLHSQWRGGFQAHVWRGQWQQLALKATDQPTWRLKDHVPLEVSQTHFVMDKPLCLQQNRQFACLAANWQDNAAWRLDLTSSKLPLAAWQFLLPEDWLLTGTLQANVQLAGQGVALPTGSILLNANDVKLRYQHRKTALDFALGAVKFSSHLSVQKALAALTINGSLGHWLGEVTLPYGPVLNEKWQDHAVKGSLQGQVNVSALQPLLPATVQQVSGALDVKLRVGGLLGRPALNMNATLTNAALRLPSFNIWLKPLSLNITGDPLDQLKITGMMQSGKGQIVLDGAVTELKQKPRVSLHLRGANFLASDLASYEIYASPDLTLLYQDLHLSLTGNVDIPRATLRFVDYQKSVVSLTNDVVYVDNDDTPLDFVSDIQLRLGDKVSLQYGGLTGRVAGAVRLRDEPNRPTSGGGQLQLVGATYQAFGQLFTISQGIAQFSGGSVTNPLVNMQAIRKLTNVVPVSETGTVVQSQQIVGVNNDLVVGVALKGPLKTSQIKLFSIPAGLSQADILSYLLLGRPTSEATGSSAQMLMSAASMLNNGSGPILQLQQQLKNTLGLEVDVGATSQMSKNTANTDTVTQNTSVILGKALSPRLFLNYSIGIAQPVNVLRLTYKLSKRWSAQTETSSLGNGGDIFYTINRK